MNSDIFLNWFERVFPDSEPETWHILILNDCKSHDLKRFMTAALKKRVTLIFLLTNMPNIFYTLDRACFDSLKKLFCENMDLNVADGISDSKRSFVANYMSIRQTNYSLNVINESWKQSERFARNKIFDYQFVS